MNLSEILTHLGEKRSAYFNAVSPPIIQTSNFVFDTLDDFRKAISDEFEHPIYTRGNNPTVAILRKKNKYTGLNYFISFSMFKNKDRSPNKWTATEVVCSNNDITCYKLCCMG